MSYKESRFNFTVDGGNNETVIFNSLRNSLSVLNSNDYNASDYNELSDEKIEFMKKQGIIVEEGMDEDKEVFIKYMSVVDSGLLELIILPTLNCNFRCPYCYEDKGGGKMSECVMDSIVAFAKKHISKCSNLHVSWFGGEPLLCMDIIEKLSERLMKLARAYHKTYSSNITTNGYYLDVPTFKKLFYKCKVHHYQITLDGREQFHNKTRPLVNGEGTYKTIINNLMDIKNNIPSNLFTILIRTNLTKETMADLKEQLKEHEKNFGEDKRFEFLFKLVGNWGGESVKEMYSSLVDYTDKTIESLPELLSTLNPKINLAGQFVSFDSSVCYAARQGTYTFLPSGKVVRCTVHLTDPYNELGTLDEKGNLKINDTYYKRWQYCAYPGSLPKDSKCYECPLYANCFGIMCPANHAKNGVAMVCNLEDEAKELKAKYMIQPELFKRSEG